MSSVHELKCWPEFFRPLESGDKTFEVRKGEDRQYKPGDRLKIVLHDKETGKSLKEYLYFKVTYVMHGGPWLPPDVWVLGLRQLSSLY